MADLLPRPLPLLTADLPGTGGVAKVAPEDFLVEEIPAYLPSGTGEHLYLWIEKRDLSTQDAIRVIAALLGVKDRDIGYAGQKDRRAVTRQWLSVHTKNEAPESTDPKVKILERGRHGNKLRLGHSKGNRFVTTLRGTHAGALATAEAVLARLKAEGLPNFFGSQRFGYKHDNAVLGAALLGVGTHPELGRAQRDRFLKRLALSALQSEIFNRSLAERMADGTWIRALDGDVLRKRASGGVFVCEQPEVDQLRVESKELDVTGPIPGHKERPGAARVALAREDALLAEAGLSREILKGGGEETEGARRPFRIPVDGATVRQVADDAIELAFALPAGAYATRLLAEVTKAELDLPSDG
jgi:tRNA pseudouridine13 synthase